MNPLSFLSPYKLLIEIALIGGAILGIAYSIHTFLDYEQKIGYDKAVAEYQAKLVAAQQAAIEKENGYLKQLQEAQSAYDKQQSTIKANAATASTATAGLRDALGHIRDGVSVATADSLRRSVNALTAISGECSDRYRTVAEEADRSISAVKTLQQAWPK